jgi:hypothetical protein
MVIPSDLNNKNSKQVKMAKLFLRFSSENQKLLLHFNRAK